MRNKLQVGTIIVAAGALIGVTFASVSTADFAMHLDRQVHDVHCSFIPGAEPEKGESGCQVTLVSGYSSVFRETVWGGVPVSLPAIAVFAFLLFFAAELWLTGRQRDTRATGFLLLATALPVLTSIVMAYLSMVELDAVCKLCIGIYIASGVSFAGALVLFLGARAAAADGLPPVEAAPKPKPAEPKGGDEPHGDEPAWVSAKSADEGGGGGGDDVVELTKRKPSRPGTSEGAPAPVGWGYLAVAFGIGVLFVLVPVTSYVMAAPDHSRFVGACGGLAHPEDEYSVMVELDPHPGGVETIEILDPLCPACRGFEGALESSGLDAELDRKALLFPLDNTCNWMVDSAVHPGACTVSYAMLCAEERADEVLQWAFDNQEDIRGAAAKDPEAAARMVGEQFPELSKCVTSPEVKSRLNRSLRWAVNNRLPVLTPQLYVGGAKLCDEDVDLGLEFALSRLIEGQKNGTLVITGGDQMAAPIEEPKPEPRPEPPTTDEPTTDEPATGEATADAGATDEPATDEPGTDEPGTDEPATDEPGTDEPATDEPGTDEPAADEPPADEPEPDDSEEPFPEANQ